MNANPEIDTLLQEVLALQSRDDLNHHEEKELQDKKMKLLEEIYKSVFTFRGKYCQDGWLFYKAFEEVLKSYCEDDKYDFISKVKGRYKVKCQGLEAEELEEKDPEKAKIKKQDVRSALRSIALEHGIDSKDITAALKFNMLNKKRVHDFLVSICGCSDEEWEEFERNVIDRKFIESFDDKPKEGAAQNKAVEKAAELKMRLSYDKSFDEVLDISYDESKEKGKGYRQELKGYWSVQFVQAPVDKEKAEKKQKHIMLKFYNDNISIYEKYEDKIIVDVLNKYDGKSNAEIAQLRRRVTRKVHKDIMPKMSAELQLRPDTWRKKYANVNKDIWQIINDIHLFRE